MWGCLLSDHLIRLSMPCQAIPFLLDGSASSSLGLEQPKYEGWDAFT